MQDIRKLDPGFCTADAEYPELHAAAGRLRLSFKDWREQLVNVEFVDVCAFRWQEAETLLPNEPYDGACEVIASEWLQAHLNGGAVPPGSGHRHLRFNFNECGQLEVLCVSFVMSKERAP
jgi:hypothetical protein